MVTRQLIVLFNVAALLGLGCATMHPNYSREARVWEQEEPTAEQKLLHRLYLVGDAGNASLGGSVPVLTYLQQVLAKESKNSSILFLGDNIYQHGMPPKEEEASRILAEHRLETQLTVLDNFKGEPLFIPGNHDWHYGLNGLRRQEKYVNNYLNKLKGIKDDDQPGWKNYFLPSGGCAGLDVVEISDQLVYIIIDSEWWVSDWDKLPSMNADCDIKNREMFLFQFESMLRKFRDKNVVVAMHHPPYTNGQHGGKYSAKTHLFPLTEKKKNLYLPLPGIGTLYALLRSNIGSRQDMPHQIYQDLRKGVIAAAKKNGSFIFVSGHEHALEYFENDGQSFIVSGSGSKVSPVSLGRGALFTYGKLGFSTLEFYEGGEVWVNYWGVDQQGENAVIVFRRKIKEVQNTVRDNSLVQEDFAPITDSVVTKLLTEPIHEVRTFHNVFFGRHYRDLYLKEYTFPTLDLSTYPGNLKPLKRGGGGQTNSLRLEDSNGHQFVLRDLTKDVSRLLPFPFSKMTIARNVVLDNFLSTHPFAPLAVPRLADALDIYHTKPQIYFVPSQPGLGSFGELSSTCVHILEERPSGDWSGSGIFGNSKKIISTPDLLEKIHDNHHHKVDQAWTLRTRLFDLVLGDWDRHDDQWRWARFEDQDGNKIYRPIPRDRDQVFSRYDGLMTKIARFTPIPNIRQLKVYGPRVRNIKWETWSARRFDHSFINALDWEDWHLQANMIQTQLTDEVIEGAFEAWPEVVFEETAREIKASLKGRGDDIINLARRHYELLARNVDVVGTDKRDFFEIMRENDLVRITGYDLTKGVLKKEKFYERHFDPAITREIHIYGLGDDDIFEVFGAVDKSILIRLIGGQGEDQFVDKSSVTGSRQMTLVYDDLGINPVDKGQETRDLRSKRHILNIYDRTAGHYNYNMLVPLPLISQNPDDGFTLGANLHWITYGFKKEPYSALHKVITGYSFGTDAFALNYIGDYLQTFGNMDLLLKGSFRSPFYAFNYFGFGNDTPVDFARNSIEYYRVRQGLLRLNPALKKRFAGNGGQLTLGPLLEISHIEETSDRFVTSEEGELAEDFFDRKYFGGLVADLTFTGLDNWIIPHQGIKFTSAVAWTNNLESEASFTSLKADLAIYQNLDRKQHVVLNAIFGFSHNFGDQFELYQAPNLGGPESLRGYRAGRFYGNTSYWQRMDIRADIFSNYNETLPFTLGVFAGFDLGRVWIEGQDLHNWHYDYGGGLWLAPADALTFSLGLFQAKEKGEGGPQFTFRLGVGF